MGCLFLYTLQHNSYFNKKRTVKLQMLFFYKQRRFCFLHLFVWAFSLTILLKKDLKLEGL